MTPRLSVVVVSFDSELPLDATLAELEAGDELIVVENGTRTPAVPAGVRLLAGHGNVGFAGGCNRGAGIATGDLLVFLNPDAVPRPGWGRAIRAPWAGEWSAWQGLVVESGGELVNAAGNEVHFTGVAWAGQAGRPLAEADVRAREVGFASGACLAVRRAAFHAAGGFSEPYFLYQEDLDLCLRLRLAGGRIGVWPDAVVEHEYAFVKGAYKWRMLERNRWATLLRDWPGPLLALVAPALLVTELAIWGVAFADRWPRAKAQATAETVRALPRLLRERREIQRARRISSAEFARHLSGGISSAFMAGNVQSPLVQAPLRAYWAAVRALLR